MRTRSNLAAFAIGDTRMNTARFSKRNVDIEGQTAREAGFKRLAFSENARSLESQPHRNPVSQRQQRRKEFF
jgi:hypothetical protein